MKKNFYLQHSLVATHDPRMKALMEEEGFEGLGAYWFIIEKLELLPEPCAQLDYLKPFCSKKIPLLYIGKIICKYQLFIIDEEGYFMPDELNPPRKTHQKNGENEQKIAENEEITTQNTAKFEENLRFFMRKKAKKATKNDTENRDKNLKNNNLTNNTTVNIKENIKDIIITSAVKRGTDDDNAIFSETLIAPQEPKRRSKVFPPTSFHPKKSPRTWCRREKSASPGATMPIRKAIHAP